jgi:hypothetical protein
MLKEFIKPELIVMIPVLYLLGNALKNSSVSNKHIPWILGAVAVVLSLLLIIATSDIATWKDALMSVFSGVTQGILCAGASVYVNQIVKQAGKDE